MCPSLPRLFVHLCPFGEEIIVRAGLDTGSLPNTTRAGENCGCVVSCRNLRVSFHAAAQLTARATAAVMPLR